MIAGIFYPIFTLTITVLACFIQKKKIVQRFVPMPSPGHRPRPPGGRGVTAPLQTLSCSCFWLFQKLMRPYFFCIIPVMFNCSFSLFSLNTFTILFQYCCLQQWFCSVLNISRTCSVVSSSFLKSAHLLSSFFLHSGHLASAAKLAGVIKTRVYSFTEICSYNIC